MAMRLPRLWQDALFGRSGPTVYLLNEDEQRAAQHLLAAAGEFGAPPTPAQSEGRDMSTPQPPSETPPKAARRTTSRLAESLDTLSDADRRLISLRYERDLSAPEVARMLGIPEGTVKIRLHRLRHRLRRHLESSGEPYALVLGPSFEDIEAAARLRLADILAGRGDLADARAAYERAAESDDPEVSANAIMRLGDLLERQGDVDGARSAYERAAALAQAAAAEF